MDVEGTILTGRAFEPLEGRVVIEEDRITTIEAARVETDRLVIPAFVNAHTHIGDSIAKERGLSLSLEAVVAPPNGLKHRLLRAADRSTVVAGMRSSIRLMAATGTAAFADFREGGVPGVDMLTEAVAGQPIDAVVFGRDDPAVLDVADGFGASGAADADFSAIRQTCADRDLPFAIHAGEAASADIDAALDFDPAYLVHMVHATAAHLEAVEEADIPIVVCPRSNLVTGVGTPPIADFLDHTTVALGTDNVMLNAPSMFREMEFTAKCFDVDARTVLAMATHAGADILGLDCGVIEPGALARLLILDASSDNLRHVADPVAGVVRRASVADIVDVVRPGAEG